MKIINGFITAADSLEVSIQPGDALADSVNPGSWETKAIAAGGKGIVWKSADGKAIVETPEQYFGAVCKVTPLDRPSTVSVSVATEISTDKGKTFKPYSGDVEIQFVTREFSQLAVVANAVTYKKIA